MGVGVALGGGDAKEAEKRAWDWRRRRSIRIDQPGQTSGIATVEEAKDGGSEVEGKEAAWEGQEDYGDDPDWEAAEQVVRISAAVDPSHPDWCDRGEGGGWSRYLDTTGQTYYYNSETGESTWDNPWAPTNAVGADRTAAMAMAGAVELQEEQEDARRAADWGSEAEEEEEEEVEEEDSALEGGDGDRPLTRTLGDSDWS